MTVSEQQSVKLDFFKYLFLHDHGYLCISTCIQGKKESFNDKFFEWPTDLTAALDYIDKVSGTHNVWFGVNILSVPRRKKENCVPQNLVWADLDACRPDRLEIPPQCVIESSPRRYQAIWKLDEKIDPLRAEDFSKRIAYQYSGFGADKSGHDLTQLLRVPGTYNFKYELDDIPEVNLLVAQDSELPVAVFETLPVAENAYIESLEFPIPDVHTLRNPNSIIESYRDQLISTAFARYYSDEPNDDWSKSLWRLINTCIEAGMSAEDTFAVVRASKCNKYERDGRPETHLWREIIKAELQHKSYAQLLDEEKPFTMPVLLTEEELEQTGSSIIDDYKKWACAQTDAVHVYHEISCAVLLSALMSAGIRIPTSHSVLVPNIWALLLGDSTLTRKTTAMDMAMDFVADIDHDLVVATDGSAEGLLTALSQRPKMVSIFYRDEVTGFLDAIRKKEYLSSMPEILTKLYDVPKFFKRTLRKDTVSVVEPVFIFFGGGILEKTYFLLEEEYITSGFLPRFFVVNGYADMDNIRRTGPPNTLFNDVMRDDLRATFSALHNIYAPDEIQVPAGGQMMSVPRTVDAVLTDNAWERYGRIEHLLEKTANESPFASMALPCFVRMSFNLLKLAALLAAARQEPTDEFKITVDEHDILEAAAFVQSWGIHTVELIKNSGNSKDETKLQSVYRLIERQPGINRASVMRYHHFNARMMDSVEDTLAQRLMIQVNKKGNARQYWPIGR